MTIVAHDEWFLSEKGIKDAQRHREKIDEQIRKNVRDVIGEESIISHKEGKKVRIPVKGLKDYMFRHGINDGTQRGGVGQGKGNPGDIIARKPGNGRDGNDPIAGNQKGEEYMEVEVDIDYLIQIMFEDLGLPYLEEKTKIETLIPVGWKFDGLTKVGTPPRMHKKKTITESLKRTAAYIAEIMEETKCEMLTAEKALVQAEGDLVDAIELVKQNKVKDDVDTSLLYIEDDDLRYKQVTEEFEPHSNAVIIAMMDVSGCYSDDTEILTKRGWLLFKDSQEDDFFATRNPETQDFEWQKATDFMCYDYNGELYNFYSKYVDLAVTPNHRMLISKRINDNKRKECILLAEELDNYSCTTKSANICIPTDSKWYGEKIISKKFGDYEISGDDYCALIGMYLSEGSLRRKTGRIVIAQYEKSYGFKYFKSLLDKICNDKMNIWYSGKQFEFRWPELCDYLSPMGTRAFNKKIPDDIMNATSEQIKIFWHYYWLGDGSKEKNKVDSVISTTSPFIRDQLLELSQKLGFQANFYIDDRNRIGQPIGNGKYTRKTHHPCYRIAKYETNMSSFNKRKIAYRGKVYCVSVPNGIVYVRRNGKTSWCGNSMTPDKKYLSRSFLFWMTEFLKKTYENVQIRFIIHTTDARLVDENDFFRKAEWGGTICHTAFDLANYVLQTEFPIDQWNRYCVYVSDGDAFDPYETMVSAKTLINNGLNMLTYLEVKPTDNEYGYMYSSGILLHEFRKIFPMIASAVDGKTFFKDEEHHFIAGEIKGRDYVYPMLKATLFEKKK